MEDRSGLREEPRPFGEGGCRGGLGFSGVTFVKQGWINTPSLLSFGEGRLAPGSRAPKPLSAGVCVWRSAFRGRTAGLMKVGDVLLGASFLFRRFQWKFASLARALVPVPVADKISRPFRVTRPWGVRSRHKPQPDRRSAGCTRFLSLAPARLCGSRGWTTERSSPARLC
jgi:hypothetical protein